MGLRQQLTGFMSGDKTDSSEARRSGENDAYTTQVTTGLSLFCGPGLAAAGYRPCLLPFLLVPGDQCIYSIENLTY